METDPKLKMIPPEIIHALQAGLEDPCFFAAVAHAEGSTFGDALKHEGEVLFGPPKAATPPIAPPEAQA